ncbi:probable protein phosphatase 2C 39 isoform X2 [Amaranthus tricolor]|uniref:probable protein phosphatase 2C 39 isoform X2 n=1 Tax=Amaranthus tricolor TaxID=29722 RepID=UPI002583D8FE|nr:probable protein phosphatase 2C 39 isoform X2 [Amaranthus tricolor]
MNSATTWLMYHISVRCKDNRVKQEFIKSYSVEAKTSYICGLFLKPLNSQDNLVSRLHKRQSTSEGHVDSLKDKDVEEVLAEIKKKRSNTADDVGSAGFKSVKQVPDEELSPEEDTNGEDEGKDEERLLEGDEERPPKRHVTYGYHMVRGKMEHEMEDYVVAKKRIVDGKELGLYAIFDGHSGRNVAEYLQHNLFNNILNQPDFWENPQAAVKRAYKETDEQVLDEVVGSRGGSTAATAILINREKLIIANVGDSRGILCKKGDVEQITVDHEPEKEIKAVQERGGFVSQRPGNVPRVDGVLAMTRAFGDGKLKQHISSEPHVRIETVGADVKFIVLASDGLWKVMSNEDVYDCIRDLNDAHAAAEQLIKEALHRRSADDISCVVVSFGD